MTARSIVNFAIAMSLSPMLLSPSSARAQTDAKPAGLEQRVPWTTSRIMGSPEPALPYVTQPAFPALHFNQCLDMAAAPGSDRLFVLEQTGKIFSFPCRQDVASADLVIDLAQAVATGLQVYAIEFHPNFEQNRFVYVCYIKGDSLPDGTHIARFRVRETDPPTIDPATETTIITWLSGGHNGCCLKFGPDGCLYISTGDATPPNPPDGKKTGQDVSDLMSSILRIDVDHPDADRNYSIPADNPFVDLPGARGEIWAYGLRNPWRMSFDRKSGDLWVGDVGWELWEMLYRVERGGNYGWAVMEGRQSTNPEWPRGPTPILPPTIDHLHTESSSITDGLTYDGKRLPDLTGVHLYGDYDTGKIWGFRYENGQVVDHRELADTTHRIVGFGADQEGDFYLLDHTAGTIHQMIPNEQRNQPSTFPRQLTETGLFSSVNPLAPAAGVISYSINAEPWADHAVAERLVAVPNDLAIKADTAPWTFPKDTVLVKTLSLAMVQGDANSQRRVETQILHFDGAEWMPYTYRWNDEQTEATLLDAAGAETTFDIVDPSANGGKRAQTWRFSGRAECQRCHNKWSGPALAFIAPQLNRDHDYGGQTAPQLERLAGIHLIEQPATTEPPPRLANPSDAASGDLEARARAYLHTNCAHCHRMHAGGSVLSLMQFDVTLDKTNMLGVRPTQGTFGMHAARVIAPGDPFRSVLLYRISKLGAGRMPHVGSTEVDLQGTALIHDWLAQLPSELPHDPSANPATVVDTTGNETALRLRGEEKRDLDRLLATKSAAEQAEVSGRLLASTSGALMLLHAVDRHDLTEPLVGQIVELAARHDDPGIRDLFERFLPPERRVKRLGSVVRADDILALPGDVTRGRRVFFETSGVSCKNCHRIREEGKQVGPELTAIGKKLSRAQLLESMLEPSKLIEPKYVTYLVETDDGRLLTGLLLHKDEKEVVLKDAQDKETRIATESIEQLVPQRQSLMPDLLLRDMSAQQVADLLEFLGTLK